MKRNHILTCLLPFIVFSSCKKDDPIPPGTATSPELIETDITADRILTNRVADPSIADYCITDFIAIKNGAVVTVQPGVTIEFSSDAGIEVGTYSSAGVLIADGTGTQKITFKGKTNAFGFWRGIAVSPTNRDVRNILDHCIVENAGSSMLKSTSAGFGYKSAIGVGSAAGRVGLISIRNCLIRNNTGKGYSCKSGTGLNQFFNNKFETNSEEAIFMRAEGFGKVDVLTSFSGNGYNGIYQADFFSTIEIATEVGTHDWRNQNGNYYLSRGLRTNDDSTTIKFNQGITVEVASNKLIHIDNGSLISAGLPANRVTIKGVTSGVGTWRGILFQSSSAKNLIAYTNIYGGGDSNFLTFGCNGQGNIGVFYWAGDAGKVTVRDSQLSNSGGCGIYNQTASTTQRGDLTQSGNSFSGNVGANVCM